MWVLSRICGHKVLTLRSKAIKNYQKRPQKRPRATTENRAFIWLFPGGQPPPCALLSYPVLSGHKYQEKATFGNPGGAFGTTLGGAGSTFGANANTFGYLCRKKHICSSKMQLVTHRGLWKITRNCNISNNATKHIFYSDATDTNPESKTEVQT